MSGATSASFVYDGDGTLVKSVLNGVTTYYVGNYYEYVTSSATKKYYYAGSQRVAMRDNNTLYFLLGDHLGSTSITANSNGTLYTEQRYYPWGDTRYNSPTTTPTTYQYTGQRKDATGLYFYNARYYDGALGRFIQADTIVPSPANPQTLNRYAYTLNNPLKYTDPTGRMSEWDWQNRWYNAHGFFWDPATGFWSTVGNPLFADVDIAREVIGEAGITLGGDASWTDDNIKQVAFGVAKFGQKLSGGTSAIKSLTGGGVRVDLEKKTFWGDTCWAPPGTLSNGRVVNLSVYMMNNTILDCCILTF